jgi:hypothetical protein
MMDNDYNDYYSGIEQRIAPMPRRLTLSRRHRTRTESLISDCRTLFSRRNEDEEGFIVTYNSSEKEELPYLPFNPR